MRDSSFPHAQKESEQAKFPHGLLDFCTRRRDVIDKMPFDF